MHSFAIEALGLVSGALTTVSFLPQVVKAARTRQTRDLSLLMYLALTTGVLGWLIYGILIQSLAVAAANAVTLALALALLVMKLRFG